MKTIFDHLENVKGKPHHVRKRIAFGAATTGTALVALVWLANALSTGAFALKDGSFAENTGQGFAGTTDFGNGNQNLAGAASALSSAGQDSTAASVPAHIRIVDAASSTSSASQQDETIIPF
ncbi:hypothetical protein KGQ25_01090 [Patescibacteria group bacterium]|nr:hypothetical protein [Patescibacteria group bacterium]MDE2021591.1 hypothetical protein [Patescibacteria group bacterium]MDE2173188.1 hypothetical protein [Patescibacteria group bacterium]